LPDFEVKSDQLTAYQILLDAYAYKFGIPAVGSLGFLEAIKRKTTPDWDAPRMTKRRSPERVKEYLDKVIWMAEDIRKGRTPSRSLMAWNSPCKMCDFFSLCTTGNPDNVAKRTKIDQKLRYAEEWF